MRVSLGTRLVAQRPQREIPHLRRCPYKECVGTAQSQMPSLHAPCRPSGGAPDNIQHIAIHGHKLQNSGKGLDTRIAHVI